MFATIFYWDYPPLHQSSAKLVLCSLNSRVDICILFHVTDKIFIYML